MIRPILPRAYFFVLMSLCSSCGSAFAQEDESPSPTTFERSYQSVGSGLFSFLDDVDEFFGNARTDEQRKDDFFRIGGEVRFRDASATRFRQKFRAGINLEAISDRLRLVAEGDRGDRVDGSNRFNDSSEGEDFVQDLGSNNGRAGLRYIILDSSGINLDVDGGLRFQGGFNPYGRIRASRFLPFDEQWSFEPAQFLLWELQDGWGEKTRFDFNYLFADRSLARSRTEFLYSETSRGVDIYQELSFFQQVDQKSYVGWLATMVSYTEPAYNADEYRLAVRYRTELGYPWLVGEIEPGLAFPQDRDFEVTPEIIFRIDFYFDRAKDFPALMDEIKNGVKQPFRSRAERSLEIDQPN